MKIKVKPITTITDKKKQNKSTQSKKQSQDKDFASLLLKAINK